MDNTKLTKIIDLNEQIALAVAAQDWIRFRALSRELHALSKSASTNPLKNTPTKVSRAMAQALADKTSGAYSANGYRSWSAVAHALLQRGFSEREAEAILRSKWTRWARQRNGKSQASDLLRFLDDPVNQLTQGSVDELVSQTFDEE